MCLISKTEHPFVAKEEIPVVKILYKSSKVGMKYHTKGKNTMKKSDIIKGLTGLDIGIRCGDEIYFTRIKGAIYDSGFGEFSLFCEFYEDETLSWNAAEELLTKGSCYDGQIWVSHPEEHDLTQMTTEEAKRFMAGQKLNPYDVIEIVDANRSLGE